MEKIPRKVGISIRFHRTTRSSRVYDVLRNRDRISRRLTSFATVIYFHRHRERVHESIPNSSFALVYMCLLPSTPKIILITNEKRNQSNSAQSEFPIGILRLCSVFLFRSLSLSCFLLVFSRCVVYSTTSERTAHSRELENRVRDVKVKFIRQLVGYLFGSSERERVCVIIVNSRRIYVITENPQKCNAKCRSRGWKFIFTKNSFTELTRFPSSHDVGLLMCLTILAATHFSLLHRFSAFDFFYILNLLFWYQRIEIKLTCTTDLNLC